MNVYTKATYKVAYIKVFQAIFLEMVFHIWFQK